MAASLVFWRLLVFFLLNLSLWLNKNKIKCSLYLFIYDACPVRLSFSSHLSNHYCPNQVATPKVQCYNQYD
jgi:hypothetical protein